MRHALAALLAVALTLGAAVAQERSSPAKGERDAKGTGRASDKNKRNDKNTQRPSANRRPRKLQVALPAFTPQAEKAAMRFVRQHLRPLVAVLDRLRAEDPSGYQKAIRQLFQNSQKLAGIRRDSERYEVELALWKIDNRIRMLAADITMEGASDSRKEELRKLFLQKNDWQVKRYELDRKRTAARLERLDATIAKLKKNREQLAERAAEQQLRSGKPAKRPRRPRPKTADVKAGGPTTDKPTTPRTGQR